MNEKPKKTFPILEGEQTFKNLFADLPDRRPEYQRPDVSVAAKYRAAAEAVERENHPNFRKLTTRQWEIMNFLNARPGSFGPTTIGLELGYSSSEASAKVCSTAVGLLKRGMIEKIGNGRTTKCRSKLWAAGATK